MIIYAAELWVAYEGLSEYHLFSSAQKAQEFVDQQTTRYSEKWYVEPAEIDEES